MKRLFPIWMSFLLLSFLFFLSCGPSIKYQTKSKTTVRDSISKQSSKPIFTIDTGGHKAKIQDVIFTSDGRYLVSASDDKTIRVWDTSTGEIVRILRGQIGKGHEGKIYAAALSPDDQLLAIGGKTGNPNDRRIRLINLQTGEVKALLKGHEDVILGLAFSPDGNRLISGSNDNTARIWDVLTHKTIHVLKGHKERIYSLVFSPDGSLAVTGSDDDTLKLWNVKSGSLIQTLKGHKGDVSSVAFTPDGKYLLSGSWDKTIRLWNGRTGKFIKTMVQTGLEINSLCVSPDGTKILMSGDYKDTYEGRIYSIPSGHKITSFTKHTDVVFATDISPDGKTAATGGGDNSEIYLWDLTTGQVKQKVVGKGKMLSSVGFAKDGLSIAWGRTWKRADLFQRGPLEQSFQIKSDNRSFDLSMGQELNSDTGYQRAIESVGSWLIQTQAGKIHKTLEILKNGHVVHEITRGSKDGYKHTSLTLTPDGQTVISGGGHGNLASYNPKTGKKIHNFVGHTGDVLGVAASSDSRFLVSGSFDQTVKLWEIDTGKLLLTIFQGTDNEWVAWTPEGFFIASPDGNRYIGYHINRGEDKKAEYISVEQLYDLFYRPDLVEAKIRGNEKVILIELNRIGNIDTILSGMPPDIELLGQEVVKQKSRDFTLDLKVTNRGGGIEKLIYKINGVVIAKAENLRRVDPYSKKSGVIPKRFTLPHGKSIITVTAVTPRGVESKPKTKVVEVNDPMHGKPSLYGVVAGVSAYRDHSLQLKYAGADAKALAQELEQGGKPLFENVEIQILQDQDVTLKGLEDAFNVFKDKPEPRDVFVLYLAGHGRSLNGTYYFLPWDLRYKNEGSLEKQCLSQDRIQKLLMKVMALKKFIILDTCQAGSLTKIGFRSLRDKTAIDRLMKKTGCATLAACSISQFAIEGYKDHGVFTYFLIEGMKGKADQAGNRNGAVSVNELAEYVSEMVPEVTYALWKYEMVPQLNLHGHSFPISCSDGYRGVACTKK